MAGEEPDYKVYRSRRRLRRRASPQGPAAGLAELREDGAAPPPGGRPPAPARPPPPPRPPAPPPAAPAGGRRPPAAPPLGRAAPAPGKAGDPPADYRIHRGGGPRLPVRERPPAAPPATPRRRVTPGRVARWLLGALLAWVVLSAVLFVVSAQLQHGELARRVGPELAGGPYPLTGANTILVLGSDARTKGLDEPGQDGPSRADSIMLLRLGGGTNASLSIPRDTIVDIPGHGRAKINAAYAIGGPALATRTVRQYLGIEVNHVVEVSFANFPKLVDALGGVTYDGPAVLSRINGGTRNGGYTLRLPKGTTEIDGRQALALARTRKNLRDPREDDLTRARRQQQLVAALKDKVTSLETFVRLPWVSWAAPRAIRSDMGGPTLLGVVGATLTGGAGHRALLRPSGGETLPDGGAGLVVSEAEKRTQVTRFLRG